MDRVFKPSFKVVRNKNLKIFIEKLFLLPFEGNETLYSYRIWKYIAKTEVEISVTIIVIVSIVTV